mgnify:CR=1 FL=1
MKPTTWAEIQERMDEYHKQICATKTEQEARQIIEQAGWTYQNMLNRLPFMELYGKPTAGAEPKKCGHIDYAIGSCEHCSPRGGG